jgi:hypothetical protein
MKPGDLAPLTERDGVAFVSLQMAEAQGQIGVS